MGLQGRVVGFLAPATHENLQVRLIHHAVAPRHGPNVALRAGLAPGFDQPHEVLDIDDPITVEVQDRLDGGLPEVAVITGGVADAREVERRAVGRDVGARVPRGAIDDGSQIRGSVPRVVFRGPPRHVEIV